MSIEALIQSLKTIPQDPGVYRMVNAEGKDLYIGKAKNLYKRVSSYAHLNRLPHRLKQMIHHMVDVRILTTKNELEALLLEANLISRYQPPYNILLKQGHSFSYLVLSHHPFPRLYRQRTPTTQGYCFGPFLSTAPLEAIMVCMHKAFLLRSCSDIVFAQRTRPCLQYHIKRCSAPCVSKVSKADYDDMLGQALKFLRGQTTSLKQELVKEMHDLSQRQEYDQARIVRDRLEALEHLAASQQTNARMPYADVLAIVHSHGISCVQLMCFRHGIACGAESFFFPDTSLDDAQDILMALVKSLYAQSPPPPKVLLNHPLEDEESLKLLFRYHFQQVPHFVYPKRGPHYKMIQEAERHAHQSLQRHTESHQVQTSLWRQAQEILELPRIPQRIEVYDNSHHQGDCPVGIMVVASPQGFVKKEYRTFNMFSPDDYTMMRAVMKKRFSMNLPLPDLMVIDGGKGQLFAVQKTLDELGVTGIPVISIAKSQPHDVIYLLPRTSPNLEERGSSPFCIAWKEPQDIKHAIEAVRQGADDIEGSHSANPMPGPLYDKEGLRGKALDLPPHHPVLHLIQRLRDEAHRFAVQTHRRRKQKRMTISLVQQIPGIGPKRYKQLMEHFQTVDAIMKASEQDLQRLFSPLVARKIAQGLQTMSGMGDPHRLSDS